MPRRTRKTAQQKAISPQERAKRGTGASTSKTSKNKTAVTKKQPRRTTVPAVTGQKRRTGPRDTERQEKRQKTRPLKSEDIPAIVKAVVNALPDTSGTTSQEDTVEDQIDATTEGQTVDVADEGQSTDDEFSEFAIAEK